MTDLTVVETPPSKSASPKSAPAEGNRLVIIALAVLTVLAILAGAGIGYLIANRIEQNVTRKLKEEEAAQATPLPTRYTGDIMLVKLNPITTNLMAPDSIFVRIEASIIVPKAIGNNVDTLVLLTADISQDIMAFLRTLTLAQLQGPAGLQNLREDLIDRANIRSQGRVHELILETMVIQ